MGMRTDLYCFCIDKYRMIYYKFVKAYAALYCVNNGTKQLLVGNSFCYELFVKCS